jgi:hypothetical protein
MKTTIALTLLLSSFISTATFATVVKSYDADKSCDLYKVIKPDSNGRITIKPGEEVLTKREAYGFSFREMEVNFNNREVLVQPMINIVLGLNRALTSDKVAIAENNPEFTGLINQLNRHILLFEKICISNGKITYAKNYEEQPAPESNK